MKTDSLAGRKENRNEEDASMSELEVALMHHFFRMSNNRFSEEQLQKTSASLHTAVDTILERVQEYESSRWSSKYLRITAEPGTVYRYLDRANVSTMVTVDMDTLLLVNLDPYRFNTPYRSLIFYVNGLILKSTETTQHIMNRFFKSVGVSYELYRNLYNSYFQKEVRVLPYTAGNLIFLPLKGPSRRSVSWLNLNHVTSCSEEGGKLEVLCTNHHLVALDMQKSSFESRLDRAAELFLLQIAGLEHTHHFFNRIMLNVDMDNRENMLSGRMKEVAKNLPSFKWEEFLRQWKIMIALDVLELPAFRHNPAIEEVVCCLRAKLDFRQ